jgi:hypothetical protein
MQDLGPVRTQPGRGGNAPGPQRPRRIGQHLQQVPVGGRQHRLRNAGRHAGTVTTPIGDPSASREPAGTGSAAAGSSVPTPPRIPVTVSRVISSRDSLSPARASRYSNRASSPRSSSTSRWAAASRRCNYPVSEAIGHLLVPTRNSRRCPAVMAGQPASSQLSKSLKKSYTHPHLPAWEPASCVQYRGHAPGLCRCDQFLVIAGDLIGIEGGEHGNRVVELVSPAQVS